MKRIVQRMCMGCNQRKEKNNLIRIVVNKKKDIIIDKTGKLDGRGAYICDNIDCLEKSIKRKKLERTFDMKVEEEFYNELKNVILFNKVQVPHYNYVGDSILGYKAHMGAGSITSNVKSDKLLTTIKKDGVVIETGLKKFGAMIGDNVEVGCNSVLNPATVIGREANIYPLSMVRGYVPAKSIYKNQGEIVAKY